MFASFIIHQKTVSLIYKKNNSAFLFNKVQDLMRHAICNSNIGNRMNGCADYTGMRIAGADRERANKSEREEWCDWTGGGVESQRLAC